jgi:DNA repair photolyase
MQAVQTPIHFIRRGRGATESLAGRLPGRFEKDTRATDFDGISQPGAEFGYDADGVPIDPATQPLHTVVTHEHISSLIQRNRSPDIFFNLSINPYRGCEHGCVYCYARPMHSFLGLSPGLDFESRIFAKTNAVDVLRAELQRPGHTCEVINIGSVTDAYQPCEKDLRITRGILQTLLDARHPCTVITKGSLIERDIDILAAMAAQGLAGVFFTLVTLDPDLARKLEPRAASPQRRLRLIKTLTDAGIPVGVSVAPIIPFINDSFEQVLQAARAAGARSAHYTMLRLPWEVKQVFTDWLTAHFPDRADRVLNRVRDLRGLDSKGDPALNDPNFFSRMKGHGIWADLTRQRFESAAQKLGFSKDRWNTRTDLFAPARLNGQLSLF